MSLDEKEIKLKQTENDNRFLLFMCIWIPIFLMFIFNSTLHSDPNSLLTDEQKIEKQKQIALEKETKDKEWTDAMLSYHNGIMWFVHEKPFPFNILIGFGLMIFLGRSISERGYYDTWLERFFNPKNVIPLALGLVYLLWVSGEMESSGFL